MSAGGWVAVRSLLAPTEPVTEGRKQTTPHVLPRSLSKPWFSENVFPMLTKRVNEKSGTVLQEASTTSSREKSGKLEAQSSSFLLPRVSHQRTRSNSTSECLVAGPPGGGRRLLGVTCAVTCASLPLRVWNACRSGTARAGSESFLCPPLPSLPWLSTSGPAPPFAGVAAK